MHSTLYKEILCVEGQNKLICFANPGLAQLLATITLVELFLVVLTAKLPCYLKLISIPVFLIVYSSIILKQADTLY